VTESPPRWPNTIRGINDLPPAAKDAIYQTLIPAWVYSMFGIHADNTIRGSRVIHTRCPAGSSTVELSIYHAPEASEPAIHLHMGDTLTSQLIVLLIVINDPASPRFDVDVDEHGRPNQLGTRGRNIPEERRALEAGLAPGQVRRGLRIFRSAIPFFETFIRQMGHDRFLIEPLFYHNAITFERYGFAYTRGLQKMKAIDREFQPGGCLNARLYRLMPFRQPDAWQTVTGRSWAIHDGILDEPFTGVQMYKRVGIDAGISTFSGLEW
jgi:hypothetical protein